MGDPRQRDVDEARALVELAERDGAVALPGLSATELCVLGAAQSSLFDEDAWSWWTALPDARRIALAALALGLLVGRHLVEPPEPGAEDTSGGLVPLRLRAPLGFVVAGRVRPAFVAVRREGVDGDPDPIRMYGIADESGLKTVLFEAATHRDVEGFGPGYEYVLASPAGAVDSLLRWARRDPLSRKVLDVYRPASGGDPTRDQVEIVPGDEVALGELLLDVLRGR